MDHQVRGRRPAHSPRLLQTLRGGIKLPPRSFAELPRFLFLQLRVLEKPHRFVLKIPEQAQLVHEVWIEREAGRQDQLQKPALAQSKNTLTSYRRTAEHNDLSISSAISQVWPSQACLPSVAVDAVRQMALNAKVKTLIDKTRLTIRGPFRT